MNVACDTCTMPRQSRDAKPPWKFYDFCVNRCTNFNASLIFGLATPIELYTFDKKPPWFSNQSSLKVYWNGWHLCQRGAWTLLKRTTPMPNRSGCVAGWTTTRCGPERAKVNCTMPQWAPEPIGMQPVAPRSHVQSLYAVKVRRHNSWSRGPLSCIQGMWFTQCKFHRRSHRVRITEIYNIVVHAN